MNVCEKEKKRLFEQEDFESAFYLAVTHLF